MSRLKLAVSICVPLILLLSANTAGAATLFVNCGAKTGLTSIGAALKAVQVAGPSTIKVSGACRENVVIQGLDRLTLKAVNGASISDASGGMLDVISVQDSQNIAINGFTINAGSGGSAEAVNGIVCGDFSLCRLSGNLIQGASGAGFIVFGAAEATVDGDVFQNNGVGLQCNSACKLRTAAPQGRPFVSRGNQWGVRMARQGYAFAQGTVENNSHGIFVAFNSTLDFTGSISNNEGMGAWITEGSHARFNSSAITNNGQLGVLIDDLSMVTFNGDTVTGNGGTDVVCNPQFSATRGTADIGGGTTNCVEP
jgi:hypothetical protein